MRDLAAIITSLLLIASLAGCLSDETSEPQGTGGTDGSGMGDGNGTENLTAEPPILVVSVSTDAGPLEALNGSYAVAVGANVTFDASGSSDPAGGNLTFSWDLGDGNSSSNASVTHVFSAAGNVTVTIVVSNEAGVSDQAALLIIVESGGPAPGTPLAAMKKTYTGTYTAGVQGLSCVNNVQGVGATQSHVIDLLPTDEAGVAILATQFVIKLTGGTTTIDQAMELVDPKGKSLKTMDSGSTGPNAGEDMTVDGDFLPGKYTLKVFGCVAANGSYSAAVTVARVAA